MGTPSRLEQILGDVRVHQEDLTVEDITELFAHFLNRFGERIKHLRGKPLARNMPVHSLVRRVTWIARNVPHTRGLARMSDASPTLLLCCTAARNVRGVKTKKADKFADALMLDIRSQKFLLCRNWWGFAPSDVEGYDGSVKVLSLRQLALLIKKRPWARINTILCAICDCMDEVAEKKAREAADLIQASGALRDQIKRVC